MTVKHWICWRTRDLVSHCKASNVKIFTVFIYPWLWSGTNRGHCDVQIKNRKTNTKYSIFCMQRLWCQHTWGDPTGAQLLGGFFWSNWTAECDAGRSQSPLCSLPWWCQGSKYHPIITRYHNQTHSSSNTHSDFPCVPYQCVSLHLAKCKVRNFLALLRKIWPFVFLNCESDSHHIFKSLRFTVCTSHAWVLSDWSKCTSDDCTNAEDPPDLCGASEGAFKKPNKQINENNDKWGTFLNFSENPATLFFLVDADLSADRLFMFPKHLTLQQFLGQNVPCLSEELEPEVVMLCCWGTSWRSLWRSEACDVLHVSQLYQV